MSSRGPRLGNQLVVTRRRRDSSMDSPGKSKISSASTSISIEPPLAIQIREERTSDQISNQIIPDLDKRKETTDNIEEEISLLMDVVKEECKRTFVRVERNHKNPDKILYFTKETFETGIKGFISDALDAKNNLLKNDLTKSFVPNIDPAMGIKTSSSGNKRQRTKKRNRNKTRKNLRVLDQFDKQETDEKVKVVTLKLKTTPRSLGAIVPSPTLRESSEDDQSKNLTPNMRLFDKQEDVGKVFDTLKERSPPMSPDDIDGFVTAIIPPAAFQEPNQENQQKDSLLLEGPFDQQSYNGKVFGALKEENTPRALGAIVPSPTLRESKQYDQSRNATPTTRPFDEQANDGKVFDRFKAKTPVSQGEFDAFLSAISGPPPIQESNQDDQNKDSMLPISPLDKHADDEKVFVTLKEKSPKSLGEFDAFLSAISGPPPVQESIQEDDQYDYRYFTPGLQEVTSVLSTEFRGKSPTPQRDPMDITGIQIANQEDPSVYFSPRMQPSISVSRPQTFPRKQPRHSMLFNLPTGLKNYLKEYVINRSPLVGAPEAKLKVKSLTVDGKIAKIELLKAPKSVQKAVDLISKRSRKSYPTSIDNLQSIAIGSEPKSSTEIDEFHSFNPEIENVENVINENRYPEEQTIYQSPQPVQFDDQLKIRLSPKFYEPTAYLTALQPKPVEKLVLKRGSALFRYDPECSKIVMATIPKTKTSGPEIQNIKQTTSEETSSQPEGNADGEATPRKVEPLIEVIKEVKNENVGIETAKEQGERGLEKKIQEEVPVEKEKEEIEEEKPKRKSDGLIPKETDEGKSLASLQLVPTEFVFEKREALANEKTPTENNTPEKIPSSPVKLSTKKETREESPHTPETDNSHAPAEENITKPSSISSDIISVNSAKSKGSFHSEIINDDNKRILVDSNDTGPIIEAKTVAKSPSTPKTDSSHASPAEKNITKSPSISSDIVSVNSAMSTSSFRSEIINDDDKRILVHSNDTGPISETKTVAKSPSTPKTDGSHASPAEKNITKSPSISSDIVSVNSVMSTSSFRSEIINDDDERILVHSNDTGPISGTKTLAKSLPMPKTDSSHVSVIENIAKSPSISSDIVSMDSAMSTSSFRSEIANDDDDKSLLMDSNDSRPISETKTPKTVAVKLDDPEATAPQSGKQTLFSPIVTIDKGQPTNIVKTTTPTEVTKISSLRTVVTPSQSPRQHLIMERKSIDSKVVREETIRLFRNDEAWIPFNPPRSSRTLRRQSPIIKPLSTHNKEEIESPLKDIIDINTFQGKMAEFCQQTEEFTSNTETLVDLDKELPEELLKKIATPPPKKQEKTMKAELLTKLNSEPEKKQKQPQTSKDEPQLKKSQEEKQKQLQTSENEQSLKSFTDPKIVQEEQHQQLRSPVELPFKSIAGPKIKLDPQDQYKSNKLMVEAKVEPASKLICQPKHNQEEKQTQELKPKEELALELSSEPKKNQEDIQKQELEPKELAPKLSSGPKMVQERRQEQVWSSGELPFKSIADPKMRSQEKQDQIKSIKLVIEHRVELAHKSSSGPEKDQEGQQKRELKLKKPSPLLSSDPKQDQEEKQKQELKLKEELALELSSEPKKNQEEIQKQELEPKEKPSPKLSSDPKMIQEGQQEQLRSLDELPFKSIADPKMRSQEKQDQIKSTKLVVELRVEPALKSSSGPEKGQEEKQKQELKLKKPSPLLSSDPKQDQEEKQKQELKQKEGDTKESSSELPPKQEKKDDVIEERKKLIGMMANLKDRQQALLHNLKDLRERAAIVHKATKLGHKFHCDCPHDHQQHSPMVSESKQTNTTIQIIQKDKSTPSVPSQQQKLTITTLAAIDEKRNESDLSLPPELLQEQEEPKISSVINLKLGLVLASIVSALLSLKFFF